MRKCTRGTLGFLAIILFAGPGDPLLAQGAKGGSPASVSIRIQQKVILPGDLVEIELTNFRDVDGIKSHPEDRISLIVTPGEIVGGETVTNDMGFQEKAFVVGGGTVQAWYRAPYVCPEERRAILNVSSERFTALGTQGPYNSKRIKRHVIPLACPSYALLEYKDYIYFDHAAGPETDLRDLSVVVRLALASHQGKNVLTIESVDVLSFAGRIRHQYSDNPPEIQTLSSAHPSGYGTTVQLHRDAESGKITAVEYPLISVGLDWSGSGGVPPDGVEIAPVTQQSESEEDRWERMADNLEKALDAADEDNLASYGPVMRGFTTLMQARLLPDHEVQQGDGITYCAGQGNWEEQIIPDGVARKDTNGPRSLSLDAERLRPHPRFVTGNHDLQIGQLRATAATRRWRAARTTSTTTSRRGPST